MPWPTGYRSHYDKVVDMAAQDTDDCIPSHFGVRRGYSYVRDSSGRSWRAHRLICTLYHGLPPTAAHHAAHSCGVSNCVNPRHIRWATPKENAADKVAHGTAPVGSKHPLASVNEDIVAEIRKRYALRHNKHSRDGRNTQEALAAEFGVSRSTVRNIVLGISWRNV